MGYIQSGNTIFVFGRAMRNAIFRHTRSGKTVASFSMQSGWHYNEDGKSVADYIDVSVWGDDAKRVGDENIGVAKDDMLFVAGRLVPDPYHSTETEKKDKINAELVIDMTSIFQVTDLVVNGTAEAEEEEYEEEEPEEEPTPPPKVPKQKQTSIFTETDEPDDNPFMTDEDLDNELPL